MNRTRKFSITRTLVVIVLIGALLGVQVMEVIANAAGVSDPQPTVTVSNFSQLYSAIIQAKDGDVIGINGNIIIQADNEHLGVTDKHVILLRMNDMARFELSGNNFIIQNVTFDGNGINAWFSMLQVSSDTVFENVSFVDCRTDMNGGAIYVTGGSVSITDCTFKNNSASSGGHLSVRNNSSIQIEGCNFENGYASFRGGAIEYDASSTCRINSSTVRNNSAAAYSGGIFNNGNLTIEDSKIYGNTATYGGADIANTASSNIQIAQSIEELTQLYQDNSIIPKGWVNDYDFDFGAGLAGISPELPNSLMKLDYEIPPTEVLLDASSLGLASDSKITGLESGKYYKVSFDDTSHYSKADGTLTPNESEAEALGGTEIIGLTNGKTYLVKEYTPPPPVIPDDPDDGETPDPTPSPNEDDEPAQTPTPEPTEPTPTPDSEKPTSTVTTDNSSARNDNSSTRNDYSDTSTVNNYYTTENYTQPNEVVAPNQPDRIIIEAAAPVIVPMPTVADTGTASPVIQEEAGALQNIRIEANGADFVFELTENGYNISINANTDATTPAAIAPAAVSAVNWYEIIKIALLAAMAVILLWKPRKQA